MSQRARPRNADVETIERRTPELAQALALVAQAPSAESHILVGESYREASVLDQALEHYRIASTIDPANAAAWDGMARVWRDWSAPQIGLPHAVRAVFHAPDSAAAHNTLGTIYQALGRSRDARGEFERAVELERTAAYALNNLCYSWVSEGDGRNAAGACRAALALAPQMLPAHNNLALAYAVDGDMASAAEAFSMGGEAARAFNLGIVHLGQGRFQDAAAAFDRAAALQPGLQTASDRARQARRLAAMSAAAKAGDIPDAEHTHVRR